MIKEIEAINKKIDKLMTEKTRADAQKEMWGNRLAESLEAYEKEYGVSLKGKSFKELKSNLSKEIDVVENKTKEEYEKSLKLVSLIESGDIEGAWKLLGVDMSTEEETEQEEIKDTEQGLEGVADVVNDIDSLDDSSFFGAGSVEDDDEFIEPEHVVREEEPKVAKKPNIFEFEDDDDDSDFVFGSSPAKKEEPVKSFEVEDDSDDFSNGDFGGFGSLLQGSKFEVK